MTKAITDVFKHRGRFFEILQETERSTLLMVPAGTPHHVKNVGEVPLFFVTVYAPPAY